MSIEAKEVMDFLQRLETRVEDKIDATEARLVNQLKNLSDRHEALRDRVQAAQSLVQVHVEQSNQLLLQRGEWRKRMDTIIMGERGDDGIVAEVTRLKDNEQRRRRFQKYITFPILAVLTAEGIIGFAVLFLRLSATS